MGVDRIRFIALLGVFALGIITAQGYALTSEALTAATYEPSHEMPASVYSSITGKAIRRATPSDHLSERDILVYGDKVTLDVRGAILARFTDTASMDPVFDEKANALEVEPESEEQVNEGDIIAYQTEEMGFTAIHRVVAKNEDTEGTYYIVKGDNNPRADPYKVRFDDIKSVVVAIIY